MTNMKEIQFRLLRADEIECRPAMVKDGKATMLLYIDSRAVVRLLNETVGQTNWCMEFEDVNGQLVGKMGIWDEDKGMFVYKSDTGSESNIEAQKGLFSDCYKRCLSRWGVDELYTAPRIVVEDDKYGNTGCKVSRIEYNENREIVALEIVNRFNKPVFGWKDDRYVNTPSPTISPDNTPTQKASPNLAALIKFCSELKLTLDEEGVNELKEFYRYWGVQNRDKLDNWQGPFKPEKLWQNRPKNN